MTTDRKNRKGRIHRSGVAYVYTVLIATAMLGICSLAVDLGRVVTTKSELRRAADAAARAGAAALNGTVTNSTVVTAAKGVGNLNTANGSAISINTADVQWGTWDSGSHQFTPTANANTANCVKVTTRCTSANGNPVNLVFGMVVGAQSCDVTASSIATVTTNTSSQVVPNNANPWLAGQTVTGTQGSIPDGGYSGPNVSSQHPWQYDLAGPSGGSAGSGEPYESPSLVSFTVVPGSIITFNLPNYATEYGTSHPGGGHYNASGSTGNNYSDDAATTATAPGYTGQSNTANTTIGGTTYSSVVGSEHGIANVTIPIGALLGVFLTDNVPDADGTIPPGYDFSTGTAQDYSSLSPQLKQPFFVGNGQNSSSVTQSIVVPDGATRLFLGVMDGHEWSNDDGTGFTVTVTQSRVSTVQ